MKNFKYRILIVLVFALISVTVLGNTIAQDDNWPLTESVEFGKLEFPFSIDYPAGWFVKNGKFAVHNRFGTVIAEFEEEFPEVFEGTFQNQGYAITIDAIRSSDPKIAVGLPSSDPSLEDLAAAVVVMYGYQEPTEISEITVMWQLPALSMRTVDSEGNAVMAVVGFGSGGKAFILSVVAPLEEALDAFLPTWEAMLESTVLQPLEFPTLTGEYQVGRAVYHMIDGDREEILTYDESDVRELMVTVYYPAEPGADDQPAPYVEDALQEALNIGWRVPPLRWDFIISHSFTDVPVSEDEEHYPVLLFSPGHTMNPLFYTALVEQVASHGYIVVVLSHPYCLDVIVFPDDRIARMASQCDLPIYIDEVGNVWVGDALFVLDQLTVLNDEDRLLGGHMDLERVGMFGHSFGGATSAEAAYRDQRILAAINMDGLMFGGVIENGITQPFMMMLSDKSWQEPGPDRFGMSQEEWDASLGEFSTQTTTLCESSQACYIWMLPDSGHDYFGDVGLLAPLGNRDDWQFSAMMLGHVDARRAHEITSIYIVAFFDKHVKGEDVPLLDGSSDDYPEVEFETPGS
jgi:hypothetical protein